jgi:predicted GH43/DUF377 family glycosyl hydrolase
MIIKTQSILTFAAFIKQTIVFRNLCFITLVFLLLVETRFAFAQPPGFRQTWEKYEGNPLFNQIEGPASTWNKIVTNKAMNGGHVLWDGAEYKLYIGGFDEEKFSIGLATSSNLESGWTWYTGNPVLTPGPDLWDAHDVGSPCVIKDGETYKMWYLGSPDININWKIGYATSSDGITWEKHPNPVLEFDGGIWENYSLSAMYVIKDGDTLRMWYADEGFSVSGIGCAKSTDGITWIRSNENPVLRPGTIFSWDDVLVTVPSVILEDGKYRMWYWGIGDSQGGPPWQTGYADSDDGVKWEKDSSNPVFRVGNTGEWDEDWAVALDIFKIDNSIYKMLYIGSNLEDYYLGLATLDVATSVETKLSTSPNAFALQQNYPNPFNPTTRIPYSIPHAGFTTLKVYNILGREIETLVNKVQKAGDHSIFFNAGDLASGIYFYQLQAGNEFAETKKMLLIR